MAREFKAVRFFAMMVAATFVVCAVTMFYTQRATYGRTAPERAAYASWDLAFANGYTNGFKKTHHRE
jgi:hypothetical protein